MKEHGKMDTRTKRHLLLTGWALVLSALLSLVPFSSAWADSSGDALPNFNIQTMTGGRLTNKTFLGKVSLLNVWGSWCKYCFYEHSMLMKIKNTYKVPIYGIDLKDRRENAKTWLKGFGNPYVAIGEDPLGEASDALNVYGTPQTFVVDKKGVIRYRHNGGVDQSAWDDTIWPLIQKLQAEN